MIITVKSLKENKDGSAICEMEMDEDAKRYLIEQGFLTVLHIAIEKNPVWWSDADEKRIEIVGQNGNEGLHYD
jgi:hypothetical protein